MWQRDLSVSLNRVGSLYQDKGELTNALEEYKASTEIMQQLTEQDPQNSDWLRELSVTHNLNTSEDHSLHHPFGFLACAFLWLR
ncbi:MAG TPA: hypothetical protein VF088_15535, partial [Pyrinomonadaceae bacterium]